MNVQAVLICIVLIAATGCQPSGDTTPVATEKQLMPVELVGHGKVLARVNGQPIYDHDLEQAITSMLGAQQGSLLDTAARQKVLKSLVLSRGMAQAAEQELAAEELARVESESAAYREQLLAKEYLRRHSTPMPVTDDMVHAYYEEHQERFGGKNVRVYELITETEKSDAVQRDTVMQLLQSAQQQKNWKSYTAQLVSQGYAVQFRSGEDNKQLLHPTLAGIMRPLKKGETSLITYISGKAYIARIVFEKKQKARPLQDVSAEIRRMLVPVQLKKAIQQVSDEVIATAQVEYVQE